MDTTIVHYDVDSDEEWEEGSGEDISDCSGDEEEEEVEEEGGTSFIDGFVVPDGYLSDDEGIKEEIDPFADTTAATANCSFFFFFFNFFVILLTLFLSQQFQH